MKEEGLVCEEIMEYFWKHPHDLIGVLLWQFLDNHLTNSNQTCIKTIFWTYYLVSLDF